MGGGSGGSSFSSPKTFERLVGGFGGSTGGGTGVVEGGIVWTGISFLMAGAIDGVEA